MWEDGRPAALERIRCPTLPLLAMEAGVGFMLLLLGLSQFSAQGAIRGGGGPAIDGPHDRVAGLWFSYLTLPASDG